MTWYINAGLLVPTPTECQQFVQEYELARGQLFTESERQIIQAMLIYSMAYTARCEQAIDLQDEKISGSFREGLRNHSADVL